ncbi:MAG TPA: hypothetical protein VFS43_32740 [Polyangiaceae bacterium]|nr:hypothetical protein [Polyangiaceae bacterium]
MKAESIHRAGVEGVAGKAVGGGAGGLEPGWAAFAAPAAASRPGEAGGAAQVGGEGGIALGAAREGYLSMQAELAALPASKLVVVRVDLRRASAIAHSVALRDSAPERRDDFVKASETGFYSIETLDNLPRIARGAWYVRRQQLRAIARASGASVSEDDVRLGYETRGRMMRVLDYQLGDRRDIADELAHLREGSGHEDLATDLDTLAELYQRDDVRPFLERDVKHYRASDVADALRLVDVIYASLGLAEEGEVERANALAQRAATLLLGTYNEQRRCGQFVFGNREDVEATYPSLISAARSPRRKRREGGEAPGGDEPDGEAPGGEAPIDGV